MISGACSKKMILVLLCAAGFLAQSNGNKALWRPVEFGHPSESSEQAEEALQPRPSESIVRPQSYIDTSSYRSALEQRSSNKAKEPQYSVESQSPYYSTDSRESYPFKDRDLYTTQQSQQAENPKEKPQDFPMEENRHPYVKKDYSPYKPMLPTNQNSDQTTANRTSYYVLAQSTSKNSTLERDSQKHTAQFTKTRAHEEVDNMTQASLPSNYRSESLSSNSYKPHSESLPHREDKYNFPRPIYQITHYLKNVTKPRYIAYPQVQYKIFPKPSDIKNEETSRFAAHDAKQVPPTNIDDAPKHPVVHRSRPPAVETYPSTVHGPVNEIPPRYLPTPEPKDIRNKENFPQTYGVDLKPKLYDSIASHSDQNPRNKDYPNQNNRPRQSYTQSVSKIIVYDDAEKRLRLQSSPHYRSQQQHKAKPDNPTRTAVYPPEYYISKSYLDHGDSSPRKVVENDGHYVPRYSNTPEYSDKTEYIGKQNYNRKPDHSNKPEYYHKLEHNSKPEYIRSSSPSHAVPYYESHLRHEKSRESHKPLHRPEDDHDDYDDFDSESVPGIPGKDYPVLHTVPDTSFSCHGRSAGFYADPDTQCQVWHYCDLDGRRDSFLCSNGTKYNQEARVCDWWFNVDCSAASSFYNVNDDLYIVPRTAHNSKQAHSDSAYRTNPYNRHLSDTREARNPYIIIHS